jgi:hypothetical protein
LALMLKFFEIEGRFRRHPGELPSVAVDFVARQLGVDQRGRIPVRVIFDALALGPGAPVTVRDYAPAFDLDRAVADYADWLRTAIRAECGRPTTGSRAPR